MEESELTEKIMKYWIEHLKPIWSVGYAYFKQANFNPKDEIVLLSCLSKLELFVQKSRKAKIPFNYLHLFMDFSNLSSELDRYGKKEEAGLSRTIAFACLDEDTHLFY